MNLSWLIDFSCKTCKVLHLYHPAKTTSFSSLGVAMTWGWWEVWPLICASLHKRILGMSQNDSEWPIFNWLVWNMTLFFRIVGIIFPTDELIFFRGVGQPPTRFNCWGYANNRHFGVTSWNHQPTIIASVRNLHFRWWKCQTLDRTNIRTMQLWHVMAIY